MSEQERSRYGSAGQAKCPVCRSKITKAAMASLSVNYSIISTIEEVMPYAQSARLEVNPMRMTFALLYEC